MTSCSQYVGGLWAERGEGRNRRAARAAAISLHRDGAVFFHRSVAAWRLDSPVWLSVSSVKFKHGRRRRSEYWNLFRPTEKKNASSVVEREQDGVKDSSPALLGSCTRGWRRRARSRRNYFLFSDPEREVDCLTSCSSRLCPCAHICVLQSARNIFCSYGLIHRRNRNYPILLLFIYFPTDVTQSPSVFFYL